MKYFIITDLDGSLLNHSNFSFRQIHFDILSLLDFGISLIPASSKTKLEMENFCTELGRDLPFIYENGAGFQNVKTIISESSSESNIRSQFAMDKEDIWDIWCEQIPKELKMLCLFAHEMTERQQIDLFGLTGQKLENALAREHSFCFKFLGNRLQLQHLKYLLNKHQLTAHQGGRLTTLSGKHDKADYCEFIRTEQRIKGFEAFLIGVGDSENDIKMLEKCDVACIIPRPHKNLLSLSIPFERTIVAGSVAPLGWLEAVRKALGLKHVQEMKRYG